MTVGRSPILITGCSSGIGRATALRLVAGGHTVWATARRVETIAELEAAGCVVRPLDVTDEASMTAVVDEISRAHGAVGALVNNAGYGEYGPVEEVPLDAWRRQFETNLFGAVRMCQLVLPGMRERGDGRIVAVSSMGGRMTLPGGGAYHASKYALEAAFDALRFEVRGFGVAVSLVEPGPVATNFTDEAAASEPTGGPYDDFRRAVASQNARVYADDRMTNTSEQIAAVIEKALTSAHPRARYLIGATARSMVTGRRLLPDAAWDALVRTRIPSP